MRCNYVLAILLTIASLSNGLGGLFAKSDNRGAVVVNSNFSHEVKAYIPTWMEWTADDIDGDKITELIISFALVSYVDDENGEYDMAVWDEEGQNPIETKKVTFTGEICDRDTKKETYKEIKILQERYPNLRITVALGGWGADGFSDAVLTRKSRNKFTTSIVDYLLKYDFDGLDIDWEFPVIGGWGAIKARPQDRKNFTLFTKQLRSKMDKAGKKIDKYLELSVAANSGNAYFNEWVDLKAVIKVIDHLNLMTYDNLGAWAGKSQPHSDPTFTEDAVKRFLAAGVPANKLLIGGAFYGKHVTNVKGLNQPLSKQSTIVDIFWDDIEKNYINNDGFIRFWDEETRSPYLFNKEKMELITYDDPQSLTEKADIVKNYNLAGVFIWDYSHDSSKVLINALSDNFMVSR